ncbi:DUF4129 domain-containing protein [Frondihabitans cladoniiphilus]
MARGAAGTRGFPTTLVGTGILVLLVVVGAATVGPLVFTGPRWSPSGTLPTRTPTPQPVTNTPAPLTSPPAAKPTGAPPNLTWLAIVVGSLVAAAIVFFVVRALRQRVRRRDRAVAAELEEIPLDLDLAPDEPSIETSAPYLRRGLRRALDLMDGERAPTDAIVEAWLGLQEAAEDAGHQRLSAETPTEFTTRILALLPVDGESLDVLRRLYLAVRFGDATATADDVARARAAVQKLADDWAQHDSEVAP